MAVMALLWGGAVVLLTWAEMAARHRSPSWRAGPWRQGGPFGEAASALLRLLHDRDLDRRGQRHARLAHRTRGVAMFNMMLGEIALAVSAPACTAC